MPASWSRSLRSQSSHLDPWKPVTRSRSESDVTARRGRLVAIRPTGRQCLLRLRREERERLGAVVVALKLCEPGGRLVELLQQGGE